MNLGYNVVPQTCTRSVQSVLHWGRLIQPEINSSMCIPLSQCDGHGTGTTLYVIVVSLQI